MCWSCGFQPIKSLKTNDKIFKSIANDARSWQATAGQRYVVALTDEGMFEMRRFRPRGGKSDGSEPNLMISALLLLFALFPITG